MAVKFTFNLKEPQSEESLLMLICRWDSQPIKLSTKQRVFVATWNNKKQLCITSKEMIIKFEPFVLILYCLIYFFFYDFISLGSANLTI